MSIVICLSASGGLGEHEVNVRREKRIVVLFQRLPGADNDVDERPAVQSKCGTGIVENEGNSSV